MLIIFQKQNTNFGDILPGKCFKFLNKVYLKTLCDLDDDFNAVALHDGSTSFWNQTSVVQCVNAKVVVEE